MVFAVVLSVGTIYASDVNATDSYSSTPVEEDTLTVNDDSSDLGAVESGVDNTSSNDVLKSEDSSTLSTNTNEGNVLSDTIDVKDTIISKDVTKYYKGTTKYTATFYDTNGTVLKNTNVKITVNGQTYTKKTNSNGLVSLDINLKPGTYKVVANNPVTGYSLTNTFKILSTISSSNIYKVYTDARKFSATFYKSNGKVLAKKTIKFKINGKTYKVKTNSNGVASLSLKSLKKGTYKIISYNTDGLSKTNTVKVVTSTKTSLTASSYTFLKSDSKTIKVRLLNQFGYAPYKGKVVKFTVNGKTYSAKTNSNGYAYLKLPSLNAGTYSVKYSFAKTGYYKASSTSSKVLIIPSKDPTFTVKSTTTFGQDANTNFKLALTSGSIPLAGKTVTLSIGNTKYTKTTDSSGTVSIPITNLDIGQYAVTYSNKADSKINQKTGTTTINVVERSQSSISWKSSTNFNQGTQSCKILVTDANNNAVSGGNVKLTVNSKTYTATTSSDGYATIKASFTPGNYTVSYSFDGDNLNAPSSGSTELSVEKIAAISVKNIIEGATTLKNYYASNDKLPDTVTVGGVTFTVPEFLYLMSKAIYELGNSKSSDIPYLTGVSAPSSPSGDTISSKQLTKANYITMANNIASYIEEHNQAPNYVSTSVGKIIYAEVVDACSRILAFYGANDNYMPNYVTISYGSGASSSQSGSGLNEKNTVKDLSIYLKSTTNCQVNNAAIKKVVDSLTSGLTSDLAKARAIYNYVRDSVSYSFYYNTKYGAAGTLSAKKGNCVDQSHLLVAMYRTAGIAARYVHGTCRFSSGSTYGHVWAQVLVDGNWYVVDATSSRNSFGNIVNWNTNSFSLHGIYSSLSF